jgi:hypothetical protein
MNDVELREIHWHMRSPARHQVEYGSTLWQQFAIERRCGADGGIVDVHNEARVGVEQRIGRRILALEELRLEG